MVDALKVKLHQFTDIYVRDLYWLLFSPAPINSDAADFPLFPQDWLLRIEQAHQRYFLELDQHPEKLHAFIADRKSSRLGVYAEYLLAYFFESSSEIEMLLHNYQLIHEKQTIGEVDYIIKWENRLIHIELAVKYYLALEPTEDRKRWVGSNGKDCLYDKLDKVKNHQLPLAKNKFFYAQTGLKPESFFLLRGAFFVKEFFLPSWGNPNGCYWRYHTFNAAKELVFNDNTFYFLQRPHWMADLLVSDKVNKVELPKNQEAIDHLFYKKGALLLMNRESEEINLIVDDSIHLN